METCASIGSGWAEADGLLHLAECYAGRGEEDDLARAEELCYQAHSRFAAMPAPGYVQAIEGRLQTLGAG